MSRFPAAPTPEQIVATIASLPELDGYRAACAARGMTDAERTAVLRRQIELEGRK